MLLVLALVQALSAADPAPTVGQAADARAYEQCVAKIDQNAERAYEDAMAWANATQAKEAYLCAAQANIGRGHYESGAKQLEFLAMPGVSTDAERVAMLSRAGNAWLLARNPEQALKDFSKAVQLAPKDSDLRIDRARAHALGQDWKSAEADLTTALDARPKDPLALRLRSEARARQGVFDLAEKDALDAVAADPTNVDGLVMLGRAREAKRIGKPPTD